MSVSSATGEIIRGSNKHQGARSLKVHIVIWNLSPAFWKITLSCAAAALHYRCSHPLSLEPSHMLRRRMCSFRLFLAFISNPLLSSLHPFPAPPFQRVKHHNILQLVDSFETKKEYFLFLELWVSSEALERHRLKCAAFCNPPPPPPPAPFQKKRKKEKERKKWCIIAGLVMVFFNPVVNKWRVFLIHPVPQAGRCSTGSWIKGITLRGTPAMWCGRCWRL